MMPECDAVARYIERNGLSGFFPKAALIDMDGTLYDSMPRHARAWHQVMTEAGVDCTEDEFFLYEGRTGSDTINLLLKRGLGRTAAPGEAEALYRRKTEIFSSLPPVDVMPGAREAVRILLERGLVTVLVTGSGQGSLLGRLDADFPGAFPEQRRVTSRNVVNGKPHPEPFLKAMALAGSSPVTSIAIDNAPIGVKSASASGAFTVGVVTGPIPRVALLDAGADIVFDSMPELAERLPELFI